MSAKKSFNMFLQYNFLDLAIPAIVTLTIHTEFS